MLGQLGLVLGRDLMADVRSSRSHGVFHANIVVVFPMMMHGTLPFLPLCNAVLTLLSFARAGLLRMISATHCNCLTLANEAYARGAGHGRVYAELKNLCVWAKTNARMGSLYRSQHDLVFVFKNGTASHINNVELGRFGRHRSNIWSYAGVNI